MNYVGIDHHRQYSHMTLMDQEGQMIRAGRVPNVLVEIEKFLEGLEAVEAVIAQQREEIREEVAREALDSRAIDVDPYGLRPVRREPPGSLPLFSDRRSR